MVGEASGLPQDWRSGSGRDTKGPQAFERSGAQPQRLAHAAVNSYLPHNSDSSDNVAGLTSLDGSAVQSGLGSPGGATSVRPSTKPLPEASQPGWLDENHRRDRLTPVRTRWETRATDLNGRIRDRELGIVDDDPEPTESLRRRRAYAVARCSSLRADLAPRLVDCGTEFLPIACKCGLVGATKNCRQWWLCRDCRRKRTPVLGQDIRRGLEAALSAEVEEWGKQGARGMKPRLILLTFTTKHTGDIGADQESIATGWRKLYKRMHEEHGAFPYVAVWEVTTGRDGLGHVHMHMACVWRYRHWGKIREQWERYCEGSQYLDIKKERRDGEVSSPSSVGNYLGKYLSKGCDVDGFTPYLRAEVSAAFYNQRSVITSLHFWRRIPKCCAKCSERYRLVEIERLPILERYQGPVEYYLPKARPPPEMLEALRTGHE